MSNQPCIVANDLNYLITLGWDKVIAQWADVVHEGLQDVIAQHHKVDALPRNGLYTYDKSWGGSH